MFWNLCCCGRKDAAAAPLEMTNSSNSATDESHNTQISVISGKEEVTGGRTRTFSQSSGNSMFSVKSYYSVNSRSSKGDQDFYSICSVESYKST